MKRFWNRKRKIQKMMKAKSQSRKKINWKNRILSKKIKKQKILKVKNQSKVKMKNN